MHGSLCCFPGMISCIIAREVHIHILFREVLYTDSAVGIVFYSPDTPLPVVFCTEATAFPYQEVKNCQAYIPIVHRGYSCLNTRRADADHVEKSQSSGSRKDRRFASNVQRYVLAVYRHDNACT